MNAEQQLFSGSVAARGEAPAPSCERRAQWLQKLSAANRQQLLAPPPSRLAIAAGGRRRRLLRLVSRGFGAFGTDPRFGYHWPVALNALGAECAHRATGAEAERQALIRMFDRNIDAAGRWLTPINMLGYAAKGYALLYLAELTGAGRYRRAADALASALLAYPRERNGALPFRPQSGQLLVDALGMLCPFLARYGRLYDRPDATALALAQLRGFIDANVDRESHLPYHGYYADGAKRLGLQGWGRGTGWYLLGLVDALAELPADHADYATLLQSLRAAAGTLRTLQRDDGHWRWSLLDRSARHDSSATSFIAYALQRAVQLHLLDASFSACTGSAAAALMSSTRRDGRVDGALGDAAGLGVYPQHYGPQPWLQGATTALAALILIAARSDSGRPRSAGEHL